MYAHFFIDTENIDIKFCWIFTCLDFSLINYVQRFPLGFQTIVPLSAAYPMVVTEWYFLWEIWQFPNEWINYLILILNQRHTHWKKSSYSKISPSNGRDNDHWFLQSSNITILIIVDRMRWRISGCISITCGVGISWKRVQPKLTNDD